MRKILINSQPRETTAPDVAGLVAELGFLNGTVLVEHNGIALRPDEWKMRSITDGDRIELLRIAAGG
jgi:sulfur carrier protein